jgi:hypothetical protein
VLSVGHLGFRSIAPRIYVKAFDGTSRRLTADFPKVDAEMRG